MPAVQIYNVVNTIANNLSHGGANVVDTSSFVKFGQDALSDPLLKESVYNELLNLIGKTIISKEVAPEANRRGVMVDQFTYGSIMQKLSFKLQDTEAASEWDVAHPENPYLEVPKEGIVQKFWEQVMPAFAIKDVITEIQLEESFRNPQTLAGFVEGLYQRMRNKLELIKKGLIDNAIGSLMAAVYNDATAATPGANAGRRVRHLLTEYNTAFGTSLTDETSLMNANYLDWMRAQIELDKLRLEELTNLYNDGVVERATSADEYRLDMSAAVSLAYKKYYGDTYHNEYVQLPKHNKVVNWGLAQKEYERTVKVSLDGGTTTTTINKIIALAYDREAVICTLDRERFVTMTDNWNARTPVKLSGEARFCCDISENVVIYLND